MECDRTYKELGISKFVEACSIREIVLKKSQEYFDLNKIPTTNLMDIETDGALSVKLRHRRINAYFKSSTSNIFTIHHVIHRNI